MFRPKSRRPQDIESALKTALNDPVWLQAVRINEGNVTIVVEADPSNMEAAEARRIEVEGIASTIPGVKSANVVLTAEREAAPQAGAQRVRKGDGLSDQALSAKPAQSAPQVVPVPGIQRLIAVASAKGGVGKSTVATNLAIALAQTGANVGLLDIDVYGPSLPTMMGTADQKPEANADKKLIPIEAYGIKTMSIGYMVDPDAPMVWRGPVVMSAIRQMLGDVAWGDEANMIDYLILDTPPGTGDAQLSLAQSIPLTAAIIVTTPQEVALADVRRGAAMFAKTNVPVLGIVENMAYFEDPSGARHHIFGEGGGARMAEQLGLPLLAELPILQALREGGDTGVPAALKDELAAPLFADLAQIVIGSVDDLASERAPEIIFED